MMLITEAMRKQAEKQAAELFGGTSSNYSLSWADDTSGRSESRFDLVVKLADPINIGSDARKIAIFWDDGTIVMPLSDVEEGDVFSLSNVENKRRRLYIVVDYVIDFWGSANSIASATYTPAGKGPDVVKSEGGNTGINFGVGALGTGFLIFGIVALLVWTGALKNVAAK